MSAYTEEEKIKILYEQSLREIREVVARIERVSASVEAAAGVMKRHETDAQIRSAAALSRASTEIQQAVQRLTGIEDGMQNAAVGAARAMLLGEGAPIPALNELVRRQQEALGWLNRAAERYARAYRFAGSIGLGAGILGGLVIKFL